MMGTLVSMMIHWLLSCSNHAVADYLHSCGYSETLAAFKRESDMVRCCVRRHGGISLCYTVERCH